MIKTKQPDARIVGGLFIYILPEHIWGKVPVDELTGAYQPELPLVGSGPYIVTEFERGRILRMERNPEWRGEEPGFDEIQFIKYGTEDAVERALSLGEIDFDHRGPAGDVRAPRRRAEHRDGPQRLDLALHGARLQPLLGGELPGRGVQPGGAGPDRAPGDRLRDRPRADQRDLRAGHLVRRPTGSCRRSTSRSTRCPSRTYTRTTSELANQILDDAGWQRQRRRAAHEGRTRRSRSTSTCARSRQSDIQAAKLIAEQAREIGVEFKVQVVSTDKLTELTIRKVDGKPAPDFDTFIWGWGGDPYDPSFLLSLFTDRRDRRLLGLLLLEPRVRPPVRGAGRRSSTPRSARR